MEELEKLYKQREQIFSYIANILMDNDSIEPDSQEFYIAQMRLANIQQQIEGEENVCNYGRQRFPNNF